MKLIALALLASLHAAAIIVDRIAISAGTQAIVDSEIDRRIRLTAFENGVPPIFDTGARKAAADRLIDQKLVEHEMEVGRYPRSGAEQWEGLLLDYSKQNFKSDPKALEAALAAASLTREDLEQDLARQSDLVTFISLRFRPAVQVTDQDVREYFQKNIQPKLPPGTGSIEDYRIRIEAIITSSRADTEVEAWLKDQRKKTKIQYLEKELAP